MVSHSEKMITRIVEFLRSWGWCDDSAIDEALHQEIKSYVDENSMEVNMEVIREYYDNINDAYDNYMDKFGGDISLDDDKEKFYREIAYISLYDDMNSRYDEISSKF